MELERKIAHHLRARPRCEETPREEVGAHLDQPHVFPVEQADLKARVIDEVLRLTLADNVKARELQPDGTYRRVRPAPGESAVRSQEKFLDLAEQATARLQAAQAAGSGAVPAANGVVKPKLAVRGKRKA